MGSSGFVIAMRAIIRAGDCPRREWLIAARWGTNGKWLSLSFTGSPVHNRQDPPLGLAPRGTLLGLRFGATERHEISDVLPPGMVLAGEFIAAAGWIVIERERPLLRLRAVVQTTTAGAPLQRLRAICRAWPEGQFIE